MHSTFDIYDKLNCALAEILQMQSHTAAPFFFYLETCSNRWYW